MIPTYNVDSSYILHHAPKQDKLGFHPYNFYPHHRHHHRRRRRNIYNISSVVEHQFYSTLVANRN